jgi:MFS family permease
MNIKQTSALAPFHSATFATLWAATVLSNVGTWMTNAAAGWLMVGLDADPQTVALIQVATSLPMFLFALPAGALSDILDRRLMLIAVNVALMLLATFLALLVWLHAVTADALLAFLFLAGTGGAMVAPVWQAIVPQLVARPQLASAVAANSIGINISRTVGPAVAGALIGTLGIAAPFWSNTLTFVAVIVALLWWKPPAARAMTLPSERFFGAIRIGLRHAGSNPHLQAVLIRAAGFFVFASAYWALLPLFARDQIDAGPSFYGILLGTIGAGAIVGAFVLPWLRDRFDLNNMVVVGTAGTAVASLLFGMAHGPILGLVASFAAGVSWIAVLSSLNVGAQMALPDWVRGRGLALFVTALYGAMTLGSLCWGEMARHAGLPLTFFAAAASGLLSIPLMWRWKLLSGAIDVAPSRHWLIPVQAQSIDCDVGPVLITVEYCIETSDRDAFTSALAELRWQRTSSGGYGWGAFEDAAQPGRFVEVFYADSWLEHLRQHQRVTIADRPLQEAVRRFDKTGTPKVSHLIAATMPVKIRAQLRT